MSKEWINDVGILATSKEGKPYIKIEKDITLKAGDRLVMKSKKEAIENSVASGKITEERGEELLDKLGWIKYELHKAPSN